jgi:hypothetical protein
MNAISKWAMALLMPVCFAQAAVAQQCTTLVYQGAPLTNSYSINDYPMSPPIPTPALIGIVLLSQVLTPNQNSFQAAGNYDFSPTVGTLGVGSGVIAPAEGSYILGSSFSFTTDGSGKITSWDTVFSYSGDSGTMGRSIISTPAGDQLNGNIFDDTFSATNTTPGTWTCLTDVLTQAAAAPSAQAQVTALKAQVSALKAQLANTTASYNYWEQEGQVLIGAYNYWANYARARTVEINALNAQIAVCRANQGKC